MFFPKIPTFFLLFSARQQKEAAQRDMPNLASNYTSVLLFTEENTNCVINATVSRRTATKWTYT